MKLVIDIPVVTYEEVKCRGLYLYPRDSEALVNSIKNGTQYEERPHGEWVDEGFYADYVGKHVYRCTHCGDHTVEYPTELGSYCKYCGSDNRCFGSDNRKKGET